MKRLKEIVLDAHYRNSTVILAAHSRSKWTFILVAAAFSTTTISVLTEVVLKRNAWGLIELPIAGVLGYALAVIANDYWAGNKKCDANRKEPEF